MISRRLPAFTVMELTISMLLAAIVIGITYTAYTIVSRSYESFTKKNNEIAVLIRLDELLKKDFLQSESIYKNEYGVYIKKDDQTISYDFGSEYIIRKTTQLTDTFKVSTLNLKILYEGHEPEDMPVENTEQNRIDEVEMELVYKDEKFPYHYYKQYSSQDLIKRNQNAIN